MDAHLAYLADILKARSDRVCGPQRRPRHNEPAVDVWERAWKLVASGDIVGGAESLYESGNIASRGSDIEDAIDLMAEAALRGSMEVEGRLQLLERGIEMALCEAVWTCGATELLLRKIVRLLLEVHMQEFFRLVWAPSSELEQVTFHIGEIERLSAIARADLGEAFDGSEIGFSVWPPPAEDPVHWVHRVLLFRSGDCPTYERLLVLSGPLADTYPALVEQAKAAWQWRSGDLEEAKRLAISAAKLPCPFPPGTTKDDKMRAAYFLRDFFASGALNAYHAGDERVGERWIVEYEQLDDETRSGMNVDEVRNYVNLMIKQEAGRAEAVRRAIEDPFEIGEDQW